MVTKSPGIASIIVTPERIPTKLSGGGNKVIFIIDPSFIKIISGIILFKKRLG